MVELFAGVGIPDASSRYDCYPHELSGGQQQRVMIAMALACEPEILIANEPTTALDVTIQEQVLALIKGLARSRRLAVLLITHDMGVVKNTAAHCSYLFISHDLSIIPTLAHHVGVMQNGKLVEQDTAEQILTNPQHEYAKTLLNSVPRID